MAAGLMTSATAAALVSAGQPSALIFPEIARSACRDPPAGDYREPH